MGKQYAILRTEKIKSFQSSSGSGSHNFRKTVPNNADIDRQDLNQYLVEPPGKDLNSAIRARFEEHGIQPKWFGNNHKNNSVIAIEVLMSTSPGFFEDKSEDFKKEWVEENQKWLTRKFGAENIASLVLHNDEKTPHLHAHIIPITPDGRLSAKEFIGGHKSRQSALQTEYHKSVKRFGLARGEIGSKTKHTKTKDWYRTVNMATTGRVSVPILDEPPLNPYKRKGYLQDQQKRVNGFAKKSHIWMADYQRMLNDPNIRNVRKAREERDDAKAQSRLSQQVASNRKLENQQIRDEYEEWIARLQASEQEKIQQNQQLAEKFEKLEAKNREMAKKLEKLEPSSPQYPTPKYEPR